MQELEEAVEEVHTELGSGFTESVYHRALEHELSDRGVPFTSEGTIPVFYKGFPVGRRRPDLFVETDDGTVVVELKAGSKSGADQLAQYTSVLDTDSNFSIVEAYLIQFNDDLNIEQKDLR